MTRRFKPGDRVASVRSPRILGTVWRARNGTLCVVFDIHPAEGVLLSGRVHITLLGPIRNARTVKRSRSWSTWDEVARRVCVCGRYCSWHYGEQWCSMLWRCREYRNRAVAR